MGSNFDHALADLDTVFQPYSSGTKRALTGFTVGGQDLRDRYQPGSTAGLTGFQVGGVDVCTMFAPIGGGTVSPTYCGTTLNTVIAAQAGPPPNSASSSCSFTVKSDGTWSATNDLSSGGNWLTGAPVGGIGSGYEVQFTITGPNTGDDTYSNDASSWISLSSSRSASFTHVGHVAISSKNWTLAVQIRDATTHAVLSNCTVTIHCEVDFS